MSARIVFDLDGTLIDSAPDLHAIANELLAEEGAAPISLDQAREFIGNGTSVFVQNMRVAGACHGNATHGVHGLFNVSNAPLQLGFEGPEDDLNYLVKPAGNHEDQTGNHCGPSNVRIGCKKV